MLILRSLAIVVATSWLFTSAIDAQSTGITLKIAANSLSINGTAGGALVRASRAPVQAVPSGVVVGTANVTGVVSHATMSYFPTVVEIASGSQAIVVSELVSADGTFRNTYGYDRAGAFRVYDASLVLSDNGLTISLASSAAQPTTSTTYNHAFHYTQPRVTNLIANTGIAFRQSTRWSVVPAVGLTVDFGSNFSASFANATHLFNMNTLFQPGGRSGAVVTCTEVPTTFCALAGVGQFLGLYGVAASLTPQSLGVQADAASSTTLQLSDPTAQRGCPGGLPPPPRNSMGIALDTTTRQVALSWDSVACATSYVVRLFLINGSSRDIPVTQAKLLSPLDTAGLVFGYAIASVGPGGVGAFSPIKDVI